MAATCTDEKIEAVAKLIKLGVPPLTAAVSKGIKEEEFVEWMRRGETNATGDYRYARFYDAVSSSQADAESLLVGRIRSAATDNWQAAAWLLERLFPERYVRRSVSNPDASPGTPGQPDPFAGVDKVVPIKKVKAAG